MIRRMSSTTTPVGYEPCTSVQTTADGCTVRPSDIQCERINAQPNVPLHSRPRFGSMPGLCLSAAQMAVLQSASLTGSKPSPTIPFSSEQMSKLEGLSTRTQDFDSENLDRQNQPDQQKYRTSKSQVTFKQMTSSASIEEPDITNCPSGRLAMTRRATAHDLSSTEAAADTARKLYAANTVGSSFAYERMASGTSTMARQGSIGALSVTSTIARAGSITVTAERICVQCNKNLRGMVSKSHPYWRNDIMCESCFRDLPNCFSCERKAVNVSANGQTVRMAEVCSRTYLCGKCQNLLPVVTQETVDTAVGDVLQFFQNRLGLIFTADMLRDQHLATQTTTLGGCRQNAPEESLFVLPSQMSRRGSVAPSHLMKHAEEGPAVPRSRCRRNSMPAISFANGTSTPADLHVRAEDLTAMNKNTECARACAKYGKCESCKVRLQDSEKRFVRSIVVAKSLPFVSFKTHLSHELFHAWLHLSHYPELSMKVEEGLCNVIAVKFLEYMLEDLNRQHVSGSPPNEQLVKEIVEHCLWKFHDNKTEIYGDGFREAKAAVDRHGFFPTLDYVKRNARLPTKADKV